MKESETIREYSNKLLPIVNKVKLMGTTLHTLELLRDMKNESQLQRT